MKDYEAAVAPTKAELFKRMLHALPPRDAVIVELGIGSFPNAAFYAGASGPFDLIGVDPNDAMKVGAER